MIRNLLQPADIKKKYTIIKAKYRDKRKSKSPIVMKDPAITIDKFAFLKLEDIKLKETQSNARGLELAKQPSTMKMMLRKPSAIREKSPMADWGNLSIDQQSMPDTTILINNVAGSMAYETPLKPQRASHNSFQQGKQFLHLLDKQKQFEKSGSPKKLPAYVSICSLKKRKLKEAHQSKPSTHHYRKQSADLSVMGQANPELEEKYYVKRNCSNPSMQNTRYSFFNQGSQNLTSLRKTLSTSSFHPLDTAGMVRKSSGLRIKSRSLSSADMLRTSAILIEQ